MNNAVLIVRLPDGSCRDIEVPLDITANQLIEALWTGLKLPGRKPASLRADNPVAYLRGNQKISDFGFHHGTSLRFTGE